MRADVSRDLSKSARCFLDVVWPEIAGCMGRGTLEPVEGVTTDDLRRQLDTLAGIDAWQFCPERGGMRGLATRVQCYDFDTFTIRYGRDSGAETEYAKRLRAIKQRDAGWLLPPLTIQAYVDADYRSLRAAAIVHTSDLYLYVEKHLSGHQQNHDRSHVYVRRTHEQGVSGATFIVVPWASLLCDGVPLKVRPEGYVPVDPNKRQPPKAIVDADAILADEIRRSDEARLRRGA